VHGRLRHRQLLEECAGALGRAESAWAQVELAAEELRCAARALGRLTGAIGTEEVLDSIFAEFCIGK
jgi:tRNA modification GTPase